MITDIPNELIDMIIEKLDKKDAISVTSVNSELRQFYSKHVIRKNVFNIEDLYGDPKINFKLSDVTDLRDVDEKSIELITVYNFPNLKRIIFDKLFNLPVSKYNLPNSLEHIVFGKNYKQDIHVKDDDNSCGIPLNVKSIMQFSSTVLPMHGFNNLRCLERLNLYEISSLEDSKGDPILPATVKHIQLILYDHELESKTGKKLLPPFLETLIFTRFDNPIVSNFNGKSLLPSSLLTLEIGGVFSQALMSKNEEVLLPPCLKQLKLYMFNQCVVAPSGKQLIPASVSELDFGSLFNQPFVDKDGKLALILPNLNKLKVGYCFNQELYDVEDRSVLFKTLTEFSFPRYIHSEFDKSLCNQFGDSILPPNLKILNLPSNFSNFTNFKLPESVEQLYLGEWFNEQLDKFKLPNLKKLELSRQFNQPVETDDGVPLLPDTIEYLQFGASFNQPVYNKSGKSLLPSSLKTLGFSGDFNQHILKSTLPSSLTKLYFSNSFNQPLCDINGESILPLNLKKLSFGNSFNQPVESDDGVSLIPNSVTILRFGTMFDQDIVTLPYNLKILEFGKCFNKQICAYPRFLSQITVCDEYQRCIYDRDDSLLYDPKNPGVNYIINVKLKM